MRKNLELFDAFIDEQKVWFEQYLAADFAQSWHATVWTCGRKGTGWLRDNAQNSLRFDEISRFKGIKGVHRVSEEYCQFMKAMLVLIYRGRNRSISTAVAMATLMILKRWYYTLMELTGQTHPIYLTTKVIHQAMDRFSIASNPEDPNVANYKARCIGLQKLVNLQSFTLVTLQYVFDGFYTNKTNLTRKARETIALKQQDRLDHSARDGAEVLISIRGFLNIVALIQKVESDAEKIALNCLLLLIITGFRSIEAFNLKQDALIKRQVEDQSIKKRLHSKGLPDYFLGIQYVGVKGAGERIHWVEPLAVPLVESIFNTVKMLTTPMRAHLIFLREKKFCDYLPQAISALPGELVELDDVAEYVAKTTSSLRGRAGRRDHANKVLQKRGVTPDQEIMGLRNSKSVYFAKKSISQLIKTEFNIVDVNIPCTHAWEENGKHYTVNYEDLLFLHHKGSLALKRTMMFMANPIPFDNRIMNKFLGNLDDSGSVFSKYNLLDDDGKPTQLRTHIPRHNINTFLAIAEVSDHLQAMLMGRMDITQNKHYQHLALAERRKAASLIHLQPALTALSVQPTSQITDVSTPLTVVSKTGSMIVSKHLGLESNIKANLHTFDSRDEVAEFIEASFNDGLFEDIAAAFEEISKNESPQQAGDMVKRHAILYPLKFGSCMREVNLWGCPYRMKCQTAAFCEHFTLTGRIDEHLNIASKKRELLQSKVQLTKLSQHTSGYQAAIDNLEKSLQQIDAIQTQWLHRAETRHLVTTGNVLSGEIKVDGEIRTLVQLFALEHKMLIKEETKCEEKG